MIDAYVIGVTLALEDGVSDGLVNIKRELGILDKTIAESTAGMEELYRLGQKLRTVTEAPPSGPPHPPIKAIPKPTIDSPPASEVPSQIPDSDVAVPPGRFAPAPVSTIQPKPDNLATFAASPVKPVSSVQPIARTQVLPPPSPQAPPAKNTPSEPGPRFSIPPLTLQQFAPNWARGSDTSESSRANADAAPGPLPVLDMQPPRSAPSPVAPTFTPEGYTAPAFDGAPSPPLSLRITSGDLEEPPAVRPRPPPGFAVRDSSADQSQRTTRAKETASTFRRVVPEAREQPDPPGTRGASSLPEHVSGDIMLDGARLGRWIGEALTTALNRPAAGLTGVDPRAMPTWPTMQGR